MKYFLWTMIAHHAIRCLAFLGKANDDDPGTNIFCALICGAVVAWAVTLL